jgi:putative PEP-CTERM system TPR-repeat lipoprotein
MKNDSAAAADLKRAVDLQPDFYPARVAQVEMALRAGRAQDALDIARQVQKSSANVPVGYVMEGDIQMTQKKPDLALAPYEKALALSKSPEAMLKVVQALQASGKTKDVQARASAWLAAHPGDLRMGMFVAEGDLAAKDYKGAIVVLESMLKTNPNEPATLNNLAWAYQQTKDPRALATAEQAYKLAGDNPAVLDTLGWMLLEQGNTARAVPLLQKASGLAPQSTEMRYHLAVGLQKAGDKPGARKELSTLLSTNTPFPQQEQARALLNTL